jgi:hypothetical protein
VGLVRILHLLVGLNRILRSGIFGLILIILSRGMVSIFHHMMGLVRFLQAVMRFVCILHYLLVTGPYFTSMFLFTKTFFHKGFHSCSTKIVLKKVILAEKVYKPQIK